MARNRIYFFVIVACLCTASVFADDWNGKDYHENSSSQKEAAGDLMKFVPLKGDERILDIGCGDGKITAQLAKKLPLGSIVGLDISPSMIAFAQKTFPQELYPNLSFVLMDAQDITYDKEFDILVSFTALMWLKSHEEFLSRAHQSLKADGVIAVSMPICPPQALVQAVNELIVMPEWADYFINFSSGWNFVTQEQYEKMLVDSGFILTRVTTVTQKDVFATRKQFEGFFSQFFPYLRPLPPELKPKFLQQFLDRFIELGQFPNGEVHWIFPRLEVVAKKGVTL